MDRETRVHNGPIRVESRQNGEDVVRLVGYAAVFEKESENLGGFIEIISRGAFDDVLDDDVRALFNHEESLILGRSAAGTLELGVDETGLRYDVSLPDTTYARDLAASVERGDVSQSSFAFSIGRGGAEWTFPEGGDDGSPPPPAIRRIQRVARLWDVSPVSIPAYPDTTVAARALGVERALHDPRRQTMILRRRLQLLELGARLPPDEAA